MNPADEISFRQLQAALEMQTRIREHFELMGNSARKQMVELAAAFCPGEVDRLQKAGEDIEQWDAERLGAFLMQHVKTQLSLAKLTQRADLPERLRHAEERVKSLEIELTTTRDEISKLETDLAAAQRELVAKKQTIDDLQRRKPAHQPQLDPTPANATPLPQREWPDWMQAWRESRAFKRDSQALIVVGRTGLCRRSVVDRILSEQFELQSGSAIPRMLSRLEERGFFHIDRPWSSGSGRGRAPDRIVLTEQGQEAYRWLTGQDPLPSRYEALIREHRSPDQVLTVLSVADVLEVEGYAIDLQRRKPIMLSGRRQFKPDLTATRDGEVFYVEIELDTQKNKAQRVPKWFNAHEAGGGNIYVITDKTKTMQDISGEIVLIPDFPAYTLYLTNVVDLLDNKRSKKHGVWLKVERRDGNKRRL